MVNGRTDGGRVYGGLVREISTGGIKTYWPVTMNRAEDGQKKKKKILNDIDNSVFHSVCAQRNRP